MVDVIYCSYSDNNDWWSAFLLKSSLAPLRGLSVEECNNARSLAARPTESTPRLVVARLSRPHSHRTTSGLGMAVRSASVVPVVVLLRMFAANAHLDSDRRGTKSRPRDSSSQEL